MKASTSHSRPRRFAPLGRTHDGAGDSEPVLKGIVFDVDGTLCEPQTHMFAAMRSSVGIPATSDILTHIYSLPTPAAQESAMEKIRAIEREAMTSQTPQPGLVALMTYLESKSIRKGICTRNFEAPVMHLLSKFLQGIEFDPIITRDFRPPKPHPAGILHIARAWGLEDRGESLIMVGDSLDDMTAGHLAGAATVLLVNPVNAHLATHKHTDLCIACLDDLIPILDQGFKSRVATDEEEAATRLSAEGVLNSGTAEEERAQEVTG